MLDRIISSLYPQHCMSCGKSLWPRPQDICADCLSRINFINTPFISQHITRPHFRTARSVATYDTVWRDIIHGLKLGGKPYLAGLLARHLSMLVHFEYDLIVPVPLSRKRLRERGYDHCSLIAKKLSDISGFPCGYFVLERIKDIPKQVGLSAKERLLNVRGAFGVAEKERVQGLDLLLIDDVMTTGATANECAKALMDAGAAGVDVLTLARA